ncbi:MAG: DUF2330 domain-containing protein [Proteobacteria bacterium]|nr:DUF2330 domain-containing protein [Pseudomonadota bacterium]MCP4916699.1 DUF2330 domain-containing protein [Pseudomonadota bacterium]
MVALLALIGTTSADPCGMVPPMPIGNVTPQLERIGDQRTYVMHRQIPGVGGVETMALRPGFVGDVEEFGMLIPFPTPPAIRKIEDDTFAQIEAAVDPPQLHVEIYDPSRRYRYDYAIADGMAMPVPEAAPMGSLGYIDKDEVVVLREEAVGMYEVAVLEAGSPKALERWMSDNGYTYPDGMDATVGDYVDSRWCFVAIKAKVGGAEGATPTPGMRTADTTRPAGSTFDGHVQGMGFRFFTDDPVVPMRLSVFNGEDPRNIVYVLADDPVRIDDVPDSLVVRQVQGEQLLSNLVDPLPLVISGGEKKDVDKQVWESTVESMRDPSPYSGVARDLFAADLLAARQARTGELNLEIEEEAKELLNISEAFGMRGVEADQLHADILAEARAESVAGALDDLREMHLTVLDGVFPQDVLARQNLGFSTYRMPAKKNTRRNDAIRPSDLWTSVPKNGGGGLPW